MRWVRFPMMRRLLLTMTLVTVTVVCCSQAKHCEQCGRAECRNLTFDVHLQGGAVVQTCCPRCALHYLAQPHPPVLSLAVRDFGTAVRIDASHAYYVEGSDVSPCTATAGPPPRDERGCCAKTVYDRCLPSLLAFGSRPMAESFAREHGGTIKAWADLQAAIH